MKKRFLTLIFTISAMLLCIFGLSACDGETKNEEPNAGLSFKTLSVDGTDVYGIVSNDTETFSFQEEVSAYGLSKFTVALDIYGAQQVVTKTIPLNVGDNTAYVIETLDGEAVTVYTVTVRRRPMYTVSFETNGGTAVQSQQVEEDGLATAPETTPEKDGYTFIGWIADGQEATFPYAVTANVSFISAYSANENTLKFNGNGATGGEMPDMKMRTDETETLTANGFVRSEYLFAGWSLTANGEKVFNDKEVYIMGTDAEYTLYAVWIKGTESLTYTFSNNQYTVTGYTGSNNDVVIPSVHNGYLVTSIGSYAFYDSSNLTSVTIPDSVTSIGDSAFYYCSSLTSVTIPNSVTSIGSSAFSNCFSLTSVYITDIAAWCKISFESSYSNPLGCAHNLYLNNELVTELTIPDSVTSIGSYAFYNCSSLTSVTIPDSVTSIGERAFSGCSSLTSVMIGNSVTSIGSSAFSSCSSLTSITIPNSVTSIGERAFFYCSSLTSVTIPNSVTSIGSSAFYNCSSLTSITFSDTSTWYRTTSSTDWQNKSGGTQTSVTNSSQNATYFKSTYDDYFWYKK